MATLTVPPVRGTDVCGREGCRPRCKGRADPLAGQGEERGALEVAGEGQEERRAGREEADPPVGETQRE